MQIKLVGRDHPSMLFFLQGYKTADECLRFTPRTEIQLLIALNMANGTAVSWLLQRNGSWMIDNEANDEG
jgi:hypothetical protein